MSSPDPTRPARGPARLLTLALARRPLVAITLLLGLLYVPWLGSIPLDGTLEGNRVQAAREMLAEGDWIVPRQNGVPYLSKPPLQPWTIALLSAPLGGVSVWSGRLVSVLSALGTCALVFLWGRRELGRRGGILAALAAGSAVVLAEKAMRAELELLLTFTTTLAVLALHEAVRPGGRRRAATIVSGLALGAAVLVKGPPPLVVHVSVAVALALALPGVERRAVARAGAAALGLALLCVLAWVLPLIDAMGLDRLLQVFDEQFVERIKRTGPTNDEPFWYYVPAIAVGMLPVSLAGPVLATVWPRRASSSARAWTDAVFLWSWALVPLVLFSVSAGKESRYLLPTVPAWALLLGWGWTRARATGAWVRWRGGLVRMLGLVGWLLPVGAGIAGALVFPERRVAVLAAAAGGLLACWLFHRGPARPVWRLAALAAGVLAGKVAWAETLLVRQRADSPITELAAHVTAELAPGEAWILLGSYRSWIHFHVARPCLTAEDWAAVEGVRTGSERPARVLVTPERLWPADVPAPEGWRDAGRWVLDGDGYRMAVRER